MCLAYFASGRWCRSFRCLCSFLFMCVCLLYMLYVSCLCCIRAMMSILLLTLCIFLFCSFAYHICYMCLAYFASGRWCRSFRCLCSFLFMCVCLLCMFYVSCWFCVRAMMSILVLYVYRPFFICCLLYVFYVSSFMCFCVLPFLLLVSFVCERCRSSGARPCTWPCGACRGGSARTLRPSRCGALTITLMISVTIKFTTTYYSPITRLLLYNLYYYYYYDHY